MLKSSLPGFSPRFSLLALLCASLPFGACAGPILGNGLVKAESRSLPAFRSVSLSGTGELRLRRGPQSLSVSIDSNLLPYVETRVVGDRLLVGLKPGVAILKMSSFVVEATLPELAGADLSGSGRILIGSFEGDSFASRVSGSGRVSAESLRYRAVDFAISGSGGVEAAGEADEALFRISGSARLGARDLAARDAKVEVTGSADAELGVSRRLEVSISGSGRVRYRGSPALSQRVTGSGSIEKLVGR